MCVCKVVYDSDNYVWVLGVYRDLHEEEHLRNEWKGKVIFEGRESKAKMKRNHKVLHSRPWEMNQWAVLCSYIHILNETNQTNPLFPQNFQTEFFRKENCSNLFFIFSINFKLRLCSFSKTTRIYFRKNF